MKIFICLLMLSFSLITGCTKPESKPAEAPIVGDWKPERGNAIFTFLNDNTGFVILNNEKTPLKWTALEDGTFKVGDGSQDGLIIRLQGDKLALGGSHNYLSKVK